MKALPLWQPMATLVAIGAKRIETRDYPPSRLGLTTYQRIAIHANKTTEHLELCHQEPHRSALHAAGVRHPLLRRGGLPLGALIATCVIVRASQITERAAAQLEEVDPREFAFGKYAPGRWAWVLKHVERLPQPIPFRGHQGAFDVPDELLTEGSWVEPQGVLL